MTAVLDTARLAAEAFEQYIETHPIPNRSIEERTYRQALLAVTLAQAEAAALIAHALEQIAANGIHFEDAHAAPTRRAAWDL